MYDIIFDYIHLNLFNSQSLTTLTCETLGVTMSLDVWLSHTLTITTLVLLFVVACLFVRWLFKLFAGLILLR